MNLRKVLSPQVMFPSIDGTDKTSAIEAMVRLLANARGIGDPAPLIQAVLEREQKDSTGLEHGVAVPHGKTDAVGELIAGVATLSPGVDFGARDGKTSRILVMTVSPLKRSGPHLQFIGEVVRLLREEDRRAALIEATTSQALFEAMTR